MLRGLRVVFFIHLHLDDMKITRKGRVLRPFFYQFLASIIIIFSNNVVIADLNKLNYLYRRFFLTKCNTLELI